MADLVGCDNVEGIGMAGDCAGIQRGIGGDCRLPGGESAAVVGHEYIKRADARAAGTIGAGPFDGEAVILLRR